MEVTPGRMPFKEDEPEQRPLRPPMAMAMAQGTAATPSVYNNLLLNSNGSGGGSNNLLQQQQQPPFDLNYQQQQQQQQHLLQSQQSQHLLQQQQFISPHKLSPLAREFKPRQSVPSPPAPSSPTAASTMNANANNECYQGPPQTHHGQTYYNRQQQQQYCYQPHQQQQNGYLQHQQQENRQFAQQMNNLTHSVQDRLVISKANNYYEQQQHQRYNNKHVNHHHQQQQHHQQQNATFYPQNQHQNHHHNHQHQHQHHHNNQHHHQNNKYQYNRQTQQQQQQPHHQQQQQQQHQQQRGYNNHRHNLSGGSRASTGSGGSGHNSSSNYSHSSASSSSPSSKSSQSNSQQDNADVEAIALEYLQTVIQCLNQNPGQFDEISSTFVTIFEGMKDNQFVLSVAMEDIFQESIQNSNFRYMGAKLYNLLHMLDAKKNSLFHTLLKCKLDYHREEVLEFMQSNQEQKVRETALFLAELYMQLRGDDVNPRIQLLAENIIFSLKQLLSQKSTDNLRCVCLTLKLAGYDLTTDCPTAMDEIIKQLADLIQNEPGKYALVENVIALQRNNWGRKISSSSSMSESNDGAKAMETLRESDEPIFYGPDGRELTMEETDFLADGAAGGDDDDDDDEAFAAELDLMPAEMDEEAQIAFEEFCKMNEQRST